MVKYDISTFRRVESEYKENMRGTIARYHNALQSDDLSSSTSDDEYFMVKSKEEDKKPKKIKKKPV